MHTAPADKICSHSGILRVRSRARDDRNDQRGADETSRLLGASRFVEVRLVDETKVERKPARALARLAREDQEPPRRELAVIRHPRGDGQDRCELVSGRSRPRHHWRRYGPAASEDLDRIVHRLFRLKRRLLLGRKPVRCKPPSIRLNVRPRAGPDAALRRQFSATRGGLAAVWRILAALVALMALLAPAGAQTPTTDSAQATLNLSAVLSGVAAPAYRRSALAGVWREGRSGRLASLDR